jgi:hypothetical protein
MSQCVLIPLRSVDCPFLAVLGIDIMSLTFGGGDMVRAELSSDR